jgi:predicted restriction endonuclease
MRRKVNEAKAIFDKIYGKTKKVKITTKTLDGLWRQAVKKLAGDKCEYCGATRYLNSHHIFGRRNYAVRWEINNGVSLCAKHHKFSNQFSAHETPTRFKDWIIEKRGQEWYDNLNKQANTCKPDREKFKNQLEVILYGKPKKLPWE